MKKVKSEMVVSNPWVWGIFPWFENFPMVLGINYLINGHDPS
jgi:hypothetical protein